MARMGSGGILSNLYELGVDEKVGLLRLAALFALADFHVFSLI